MGSKKNRLLLLDLDGTLADSMTIGLEEINALSSFFGYAPLKASDHRLRHTSGYDFAKKILGLKTWQILIWGQMLKRAVVRRFEEIQLYEGWKTTLQKLPAGWSWGVVTSSPREYAEQILWAGGLFDYKILIADVGYLNKSKALRNAAFRCALPPEQITYVGDEKRDAVASQKIGMRFIAAGWGKDHPDVFKKVGVRRVLKKPGDVVNFLRRNDSVVTPAKAGVQEKVDSCER